MAPGLSKPSATVANRISTAKQTGSQVVSTIDFTISHLLEFDMAYRMQIPPTQVGPHFQNRDGYGLSPLAVHKVGKQIVHLGWSWDACSHAVCIEDDDLSTIGIFSEQLAERNRGLAPMPKSKIKFGSLSCGHTNHFLAAVQAGVASTEPNLSIDGRLSGSLIGGRDTAFAEALAKGLHWLVLRKEVATLYPDFCSLVQYGRNAVGAVQQQESEVQLLMLIQQLAEEMHRNTSTIDWKLIASDIAKRMNQHAVDAKSYVEYVRRWGGGIGGKFIKDLYRFHQLFVPDGRIISLSTIDTLAHLKVKEVAHTCIFLLLRW